MITGTGSSFGRASRVIAAGVALSLGLAGCVNLSQPHTPKSHFVIAPQVAAARPAGAERSGSVRIMRVRVAPPSEGRMFVYRVGENEFALDYFNIFVADPDQMLTAALVDAMTDAGPFVTVAPPGGGADASMRLETTVLALHADLRDASRPAAVIRARFTLLHDADGATRVLGQWTRERVEPIRSASPDDIAGGFGAAWGGLLGGLASDAAGALGARWPAP